MKKKNTDMKDEYFITDEYTGRTRYALIDEFNKKMVIFNDTYILQAYISDLELLKDDKIYNPYDHKNWMKEVEEYFNLKIMIVDNIELSELPF